MQWPFPRRGLRTAAALVAMGAAAVGTVAIAKPAATPSQADDAIKPVLIETRITFPENPPARGTITRLFIGQRELCRGARFEDEGTSRGVTKRIDCGSRGRLVIRFDPGPNGENVRNQSSSWRLIGATRSFRGLRGGGTMFARFEARAPRGRETFTGTLR